MIADQIAELIWTVTNDYLNRKMGVEQFTSLIRGIHTGIDMAGMRTEVDAAYSELCRKKHGDEAA
jgi:hypothetical protein